MTLSEQIIDELAKFSSDAQLRILFSEKGYVKALCETDALSRFGQIPATTFLGRPFGIVPGQEQEFVIERFQPRVVEAPLSMEEASRPVFSYSLVGSKLDAAQLCDVIRGFLDADDATHWGEFEKQLDRVVTEQGRFE